MTKAENRPTRAPSGSMASSLPERSVITVSLKTSKPTKNMIKLEIKLAIDSIFQ